MTMPVIAHGSKLGLHTIFAGASLSYAAEMANRGAPFAVLKSVGPLDIIPEFKRVSPASLTVSRIITHAEAHRLQALSDQANPPIEAIADDIIAQARPRLEPHILAATDYVELINEPDPPTAAGYANLARLGIALMDRAERLGWKLLLFSLNAGSPEWDEMQAMAATGVFGRMKAGGHVLGLHEGVFGADQPIALGFGDRIPGAPGVAGAGSMCLRYRYLYSILAARNEVVPLVISEFYAGGGYVNVASAEEVARRMAWYDSEVRQDPYVLGFLPFTIGPNDGWERANYEFAYPALMEYAAGVKDLPNAVYAEPGTGPVPGPAPSQPIPPVTTPSGGPMPSKLSILAGSETARAMEFIRRARPPLVKVLGDFRAEGHVKAVSPGTVVVGRIPFSPQPAVGQGDPRFRAREFFEAQREAYLARRYVDYWEGWNEPAVDSPEDMAWYADFEIERMRLLAGIGRRACLGNFATGRPGDIDLWRYFYPALRTAAQPEHGAILGLHEYSAPWMDSFFGRKQLNPNEDAGDTGWTTGRYRKVYRDYLLPAGLAIPLAITECGIDGSVMAGPRSEHRFDDAPRRGGWRGFTQWWLKHGGLADPAQEYMRQLAWYDARLREDSYVIGAAIFQVGMTDDNPARFHGSSIGTVRGDRNDFDIDGEVIDKLTGYAEQTSAKPTPSPTPDPASSPPAPSPTPSVPPTPSRGSPRVQYTRTYVLLPPAASVELVRAVAGYFHAERFTLGFSADDAGIGALDQRRVVAIDPGAWPSDLRSFFAEHYPGVEYTSLGSAAIFARTKILPRD